MVSSMTGFGRDSIIEAGKSFVIEIKSVNHRYMDLNIKMPRVYLTLEERIRNVIKEKLNRGKIDIYINMKVFERTDVEAVLNKSLAASYVKCLKEIQESFDLRDDVSVINIARFPEVVNVEHKEEDVELIWETIKKPLEGALDKHMEMRLREGQKLKEDLLLKCSNIELLLKEIQDKSTTVVLDYKEKLENRLKEIVEDKNYDEGRVAMEMAIIADKCCIDEELVRLASHLSQIKDTLEIEEPIGRKLDFIVQEMNREANTISSKSNDLTVTKNILQVKSEIEKIREQTQNIE